MRQTTMTFTCVKGKMATVPGTEPKKQQRKREKSQNAEWKKKLFYRAYHNLSISDMLISYFYVLLTETSGKNFAFFLCLALSSTLRVPETVPASKTFIEG